MTTGTHAAFVRLTSAGFSDEQAEAILASGHDLQAPLATKSDLAELRTELKGDTADLRTELKGDMTELRAELKGDMTELRAELKSDMTELRADMAALELRLTLRMGAGFVLAIGVLGTLIAVL